MSEVAQHPDWDTQHLRMAVKAAGVALWSWNVDTDSFSMDEAAFELWDLPRRRHVAFEDLSAHIHPADRNRVRAAFQATRGILGAYEIDFRVLLGDRVRWISARGQGDDAGIVERLMFGIFLDVTGRKQAEEANELLAGEMSHRVKNLLAIAQALTKITSRSTATVTEMAEDLSHRLAALGRAHDLVRPLPGRAQDGALLADLLSIVLAPYDDTGAFCGRIRIAVPRMRVGLRGATALALVLHELATNSLKYGALSGPDGLLDVSCDAPDASLTLTWTERGGPEVVAPSGEGFGSQLLHRAMSDLGGSAAFEWAPAGAIIKLQMMCDRLSS